MPPVRANVRAVTTAGDRSPQRDAAGRGEGPGDDRPERVREGDAGVPVEQQPRVDGERAVRREAAEHARADEQAEVAAASVVGSAAQQRLEQQPQRERAHDVDHGDRDGQRAGRRREGQGQRLPGPGAEGPTDDDQGVKVDGQANIQPTDANGIAFSRNPGQVLNVVYLNSKAATSGGFFPAGVNGVVNTSQAN